MISENLSERLKKTLDVKEKLKAKGQDPERFCLVPFTTLILEPDGKVGICRLKGNDFPIGNIKTQTLSEIWNGPFAKKWRKEFLDGKPKICERETRHLHCQHSAENNMLLEDADLNEVQKKPLLKLTANFNGKCNLRCIMCDVWEQPNGLYDDINFWEPAKKDIFPYLREIDMLAGEPFIQPDTYRLMDEVYKVNPDCRWMFNTNIHWKLNDKIKGYLDRIKVKNLIMSVDGMNAETYSRIRVGGRWDFVLKNIDDMIQYNQSRIACGLGDMNLTLNFLVQKDNWQELGQALDFCQQKKIRPFISFLYLPEQFSLLKLSEKERENIVEKYIYTLSTEQILHSMRILTPLIESLQPIARASFLFQLQPKLSEFEL